MITALGSLLGSPEASQVMVPVKPVKVISVIAALNLSQSSEADISAVAPAFFDANFLVIETTFLKILNFDSGFVWKTASENCDWNCVTSSENLMYS